MIPFVNSKNDVTMMDFNILCCHPGYKFNEETSVCEIDAANNSVIVRAHLRGRYFYAKVPLLDLSMHA